MGQRGTHTGKFFLADGSVFNLSDFLDGIKSGLQALSVSPLFGEPGVTLKHNSTDAAQKLENITGWADAAYDAVLVSVSEKSLAFAWGANPTASGGGHVLDPGQFLTLTRGDMIDDFRFLSNASGEPAKMAVTPFTRS